MTLAADRVFNSPNLDYGRLSPLLIVFGAALGNVVRGVPLDAEGYFFLPLWTGFSPLDGHNPGVLDCIDS